jgi:acetate---CoA ligase (ADP-forming)
LEINPMTIKKPGANVGTTLAKALFAPDSIALIGASADVGKHTSLPQRYLRKHGFTGKIFPVNPTHQEIFGERAYASADLIPERVDHAFIMLPARLVPEAVSQCAAIGIRCATILSAGFAEIGEAGRKLQQDIFERAHPSGMRILGPNCLGVINTTRGVAISANESLETPQLLRGHVSLLSQSGSLLGSLLSRGQSRGLGFAKMVSVGNEADLGVGELGDLLVDDPDTHAILLFLETVRDPQRFSSMARRAYAAGKPIIAFLLGRSPIGNQLAASHTGAIAGNTAAMEAFLQENGVIRVDLLETLIEMAPFVIGRKPDGAGKVSVMGTTGGGGALLVDNLGMRGIAVAGPDPQAIERLAAQNIAISDSPLIDLTMAGTNPRVFGAVMDAMMASPDNEALITVVGSSSQFRPDRAVVPIIDRAKASAKPVAVFLTPDAPESSRLLTDASIAVFRTPEACADAVRAYFNWQAPVNDALPKLQDHDALTALAQDAVSGGDAGKLLDRLGIEQARTVNVAIDASEADIVVAVTRLKFPVAIKIVSADIPHKTEAGGVLLNVADVAALHAGMAQMGDTVRQRRPDATIEGFSIQEMRTGLGEVLVGYRVDPRIGPTIVVGVGGILAEIYRDAVVALAPISVDRAHEMIRQLRGLAPLRGYRNLPEGDLPALANAISAWSRIAQLADSGIAEAELNPLIIGRKGQGVVAVDALFVPG